MRASTGQADLHSEKRRTRVGALSALVLLASLAAAGCGGDPCSDASLCDPSADADPARAAARLRAETLVARVRGTPLAYSWGAEARLEDAPGRPLYRPDVAGVAYYEFGVRPAGFVVVATGEHDYPIAHWSFSGRAPSATLLRRAARAGRAAARIYKLDALSYVAEDDAGELVARLGSLPVRLVGGRDRADAARASTFTTRFTPRADGKGELLTIERRPDGVEVEVERRVVSARSPRAAAPYRASVRPFTSWAQLKAAFTGVLRARIETYQLQARAAWRSLSAVGGAQLGGRPALAGQLAPARSNGTVGQRSVGLSDAQANGDPDLNVSSAHWAIGAHGSQRLYKQFWYNSCRVGCGATSWMMLFGWADVRAAAGDRWWKAHHKLYLSSGGNGYVATAPRTLTSTVKPIIRQLNEYIDTFCVVGGDGATAPWDMSDAHKYLLEPTVACSSSGCTYGQRSALVLTTSYNMFGATEDSLRNKARDRIMAGVPAIIGTGWLAHYPLAYGYGWYGGSRYFYVNQGWGGEGNGWIPASTWFYGSVISLSYMP